MYTCKKVAKTVFYYHLYFLGIYKVRNLLHHESVERVKSKECHYIYTYTLKALFILFIFYHSLFIYAFFDNYQIPAAESEEH